MGGIATSIAGAVDQPRSATQEIARTVQDAARGTADVLGTIGAVRDAASETRVAADRVVDTTADLVAQSGALSRDAAEFLSHIRVA
jgi:methyl-accepting chemotaxis protein